MREGPRTGSDRMASATVLFAHAASLQATARTLVFRTSSDTHPNSPTPGRIASPCVSRFLQSLCSGAYWEPSQLPFSLPIHRPRLRAGLPFGRDQTRSTSQTRGCGPWGGMAALRARCTNARFRRGCRALRHTRLPRTGRSVAACRRDRAPRVGSPRRSHRPRPPPLQGRCSSTS